MKRNENNSTQALEPRGPNGEAGQTRETVLIRASEIFAEHGYGSAPIGEIATAAGVTKPTVYYHFGSKAGLYQALLDRAEDEVYMRMREAADAPVAPTEKLTRLMRGVFRFTREQPDLVRIAFQAAFSARGELPPEVHTRDKSMRNFQVVLGIIEQGQNAGQFTGGSGSFELALAFYGQMVIHVMTHLTQPDWPFDESVAEQAMRVYLNGAQAPAAH